MGGTGCDSIDWEVVVNDGFSDVTSTFGLAVAGISVVMMGMVGVDGSLRGPSVDGDGSGMVGAVVVV